MRVRGAPLIGATAAYGLALALHADPSDMALRDGLRTVARHAPHCGQPALGSGSHQSGSDAASPFIARGRRVERGGRDRRRRRRDEPCDRRPVTAPCSSSVLAARGRNPVQILTHCNAGALATLGWGTATAPIYVAHSANAAVHVWVSETRPRMQGAKLTTWELRANQVPHTLIVDAAGAALMRQGRIDLVLVGADRVARNGDVCNKIGTYEKALAAQDNGVPMYVAVPSSTIDWTLADGSSIPIEERAPEEVLGSDAGDQRRACGNPRPEPGIRRDAGAPSHWPHHRARNLSRHGGRSGCDVSGASRMTKTHCAWTSIATAIAMNERGINRGKSGNVSARTAAGFLITPTGLPYESLLPADIVAITHEGAAIGPRLPSSEWRIHKDIYATRADAGAIVHAHSSFATSLACLGRDIPGVSLYGGGRRRQDIRCAPYATFGTQELSDSAIAALSDRRACLLANHGMIALGSSLDASLALAIEVEALAEQYWRALQIGAPTYCPTRK